MTYKVFVELTDWRRTIDLLIYKDRPDGGMSVVEPFVIRDLPENELLETPTMRGRKEEIEQFLQAMLDCAWSQGLRPAGFLDTPNQIAAMKEHLSDMRRIALQFVDREAPPLATGPNHDT